MQPLADRFDAAAIEAATRSFWAGRPALSGESDLGPETAPATRQLLGTLFPSDEPFALWHREVAADVEARFLAMSGRRVRSAIQIVPGQRHDVPGLLAGLVREGIRLTSDHAQPADPQAMHVAVQRMLERLAARRVLVLREQNAPCCPRCLLPRTPEGIVYQEETGDSLVVRFALRGTDPPANLLVWTDFAWKLLGTTAVGVAPTTTYVTGRYRRREHEEVIVLAKEAVPRLGDWLPGGAFEPVREQTGAELAGASYLHPLSIEYPTVGGLPPPAGTVVPVDEVDGTGSGLVALVPSHGFTDASVGARLHLPGLPVLTADGRIERVVMHKYAGLPLEIAEAFIHRDLSDGGALFAEPRWPRGVPRCAACGSPLLWLPTRTWYLDPAKAGSETVQLYRRLLPDGPAYPSGTGVGWVAGKGPGEAPSDDPILLECESCERLAPPGESGPCPCGAARHPVRRGLATALRETLSAWARLPSLAPSDDIVLYLPERRLAPALIHHLISLESTGATFPTVRLVRVASVRAPDAAVNSAPGGEDARRLAILGLARAPRVASTLADREVREARRLARVWHVVHGVIDQMLADGFRPEAEGAASHRSDLLEEDAALLSAFERKRAEVLDMCRAGQFPRAAAVLADFFENDLRREYLRLAGARLRSPGLGPLKVSAYRVLGHVLPLWVELYAPFAPFTLEALHRALREDSASVFERRFAAVQETLVDRRAEEGAEWCRAAVHGLALGRRMFGIAREARLSGAVIVSRDEPTAARLRASLPTLARTSFVTQLTVASPSQPWEGAQVVATPVLEELHRVYAGQGPRVARLLQQVKPRRIQEGLAAGNLTVALDGASVPILPPMVEISESLPENTVAVPWSGGEIYMTLPPRLYEGADVPPPAVSVEATRLLREVRRRLRRRGPGRTAGRAVVLAGGALGSELAARTKSIARYLGVSGVEVVATPHGFVRSETVRGRTRRGDRWAVWLPGGDLPARPRKRRTPRSAAPRIRLLELGQESGDPDVLSEETVHRTEQIRAMVEQLDGPVGRPLLGPSKLGSLWDAGIRDLEGLRAAPFDTVSVVPGFGPYVTEEVLRRLGATVPDRPARHRPLLGFRTPEPEVTAAAGPAGVGGNSAGDSPEAASPHSAPPPVPAGSPRSESALPDAIPEPRRRTEPSGLPVPPRPSVDDPPPPAEYEIRPPVEYAVASVVSEPVPVAAPAAAPAERRFGVEVWPGPSTEAAWRRFLDLTGLGVRGLCFTREFPDRIRGAIGSRVVEVAWLSNTGREGSVRPGDLGAIEARIAGALSETRVRAVFLGGMEYLVSLHGREKVATFLRTISDLAVPVRARIWVPMNPALIVPGAAEEFAAQYPADVSS